MEAIANGKKSFISSYFDYNKEEVMINTLSGKRPCSKTS